MNKYTPPDDGKVHGYAILLILIGVMSSPFWLWLIKYLSTPG